MAVEMNIRKFVVKDSSNMREADNIVSQAQYAEMKAGVLAPSAAEQEWQNKYDSGDFKRHEVGRRGLRGVAVAYA